MVGIFSQVGFPPPISALSDQGSIFTVGIFHRWDFLNQSQHSQIREVFSQLGFFTGGISSTNLRTSDQGSIFTVGIFLGILSQLGFSPPILALSDRGSFSQLGFSQVGFPPPISALSDRGSIFTVGSFSQVGFPPSISALSDLGSIFWPSQIGGVFSQLGFFHSWDCLH